MAAIEDWWYPVRLSCEQCSSEPTARWKAERLEAVKSLEDAAEPLQDGSKAAYRLEAKGGETHTPYPLSITQERARGEGLEAGKPIPHIHYPLPKKRAKGVLVDLTGGYGVDTYFMSEHFAQVHYVEQNEELCRIAQHNFALTRPHIQVHNTHAEEFLSRETNDEKCVFYIDPARRDKHGGKVFRIEDCEPNVVALLPTLLRRAERIIIKLSPMLDITAALRSLQIPMDVDIVAVNNEVKEVLLWSKIDPTPCRIHAVNLGSKTAEWSFTQEEERQAQCILWDAHRGEPLTEGTYIYEPNAAILKAGAYKLVGARYGLQKW